MKSIRLVGTIIFFATLFTACHKDTDTGYKSELLTTFSAKVVKEVQSTILGIVVDEQNNPVADAVVQIYSTTTKTDKNGLFVIKNARMDEQGTYVRVQKSEYIIGSDMVYPTANTVNYSRITIMKLETNNLLDAAVGGTVPISNGGGKILFEPNSIVFESTKLPYIGTVLVTAKYINPSNENLPDLMPGGLIADAANGNTVVLGTLGMVAVELRDENGNELNLDPSKKATISFPVNTSYRPATIPLWSFDEIKGWWKEDGQARLEGDFYVAQVSHFSFWNCDAPFPLVNICGKILDKNNQPITNTIIQIIVEGLGVGYGYTNSDGIFMGKVPKGKVLKILVNQNGCNEFSEELTVGPFENDVKLDNIILETPVLGTIAGTIKCGNTIVANGIGILKVGPYRFPFLADELGNFTYGYSQYACQIYANEITLFGIDNLTGNTSAILPIQLGVVNGINLDVCNSPCLFTATLTFDCDNAIVSAAGGSGNYTYSWENFPNVTTSTLPLTENDSLGSGAILCVTVTDLSATGCSKTLCKASPGILQINAEIRCGSGNDGGIYLFSNQNPSLGFTYQWSNGATTNNVNNLVFGTYCVTVTNANGCSKSKCFDIIPLSVDMVTGCSGSSYTIDSTPFTTGVVFGSGTSWSQVISFPIIVDVRNLGYIFQGSIQNGSCSLGFGMNLPRLVQGITVTQTVPPTCDTCSDGKIGYTLNSPSVCESCTVGPVKLFLSSDTNTDLISNINGNLPKGKYTLVVTDQVSGCWIAHREVSI